MDRFETLGTRLGYLRTNKSMSDKQTADDMQSKGYFKEYTPRSLRALINAWENNSREPDRKNLIALADYYGVTTDYILGRSDMPITYQAKATLLNIYSHTPYTDTLNSFLSSPWFEKLIREVDITKRKNQEIISEILSSKEFDQTLFAIKQTEARHILRDLAEDFEDDLRHICDFTGIKNAIDVKTEYAKKGSKSNGINNTDDN